MLRNNNFENNLDTIITETKIEVDQLYSRYVYGDIDNGTQNATLKLLSTIDNMKSKTTPTKDNAVSVIIFYSQGHLIPLNNWENPFYFLIAFLTLFFFGNDGHLKNKK